MTSLDEPALLAQAGPAGLALASDRRFQLTAHLELINREIVEGIARAFARQADEPEILLVEVPPRHGKSTLISENAPAWFVGTFPDRRVILCSYEADFAGTWGGKARDKLEEYGEALFGVQVRQGSKAAKRWDLAGEPGGMMTAGVGGPITGKGAHLLIIDDPVKNAEEAMSEVMRAKQAEWWLSTARPRLEPGAFVCVLMTRWHRGDLGGYLLDLSRDGGDPVHEIRLPALAEANDPLGREQGEALWPERYSRGYLEHTRHVLGPYWFSALYQGSPTPDEGGIFNRADFRYFTIEDDRAVLRQPDGSKREWGIAVCHKLTVVDLAVSEKETADYTVIAEIWVTPDREMLVRSVVRERIAGPDQADFIANHHGGGPILVETIGYQTALVQALLRRGLPVEPVYPDKDKVTRASAAGVLYRQGKVYHLAGAEWLHDFELELLAFPAGDHDDQVDVVAYAARALPSIGGSGRKQRDKGQTITGGVMKREF
jgi:predicted phage terminase large subunit-like protein